MDLISEIVEQITKAKAIAFEKMIKTNAIILNEEFDFIPQYSMICGKHVFVGKLPSEYSFALTYSPYTPEAELEYYKRKCEELEEKLKTITDILEGNYE